ncbi:hypothetical protein JAAARDRAFT_588047 [Jaapia argillacea MUCL 33604]|uniref:Uncharacterized protein n=1 Tax=Jaapia argillacea MUCL 33604 TaxID=933084 RepID=A0A067P6A7_9AGAM|nr:hypothetical protein JAAARDRAFT_588047 [Jaapia argillacea MUCL 33604]
MVSRRSSIVLAFSMVAALGASAAPLVLPADSTSPMPAVPLPMQVEAEKVSSEKAEVDSSIPRRISVDSRVPYRLEREAELVNLDISRDAFHSGRDSDIELVADTLD